MEQDYAEHQRGMVNAASQQHPKRHSKGQDTPAHDVSKIFAPPLVSCSGQCSVRAEIQPFSCRAGCEDRQLITDQPGSTLHVANRAAYPSKRNTLLSERGR